jgi:hypothetical protein
MAATDFTDGVTRVTAAFLDKIFGTNGHVHDGSDADGSAPKIDVEDHIDWFSNADVHRDSDNASECRLLFEHTGAGKTVLQADEGDFIRLTNEDEEISFDDCDLVDISGIQMAGVLQSSGEISSSNRVSGPGTMRACAKVRWTGSAYVFDFNYRNAFTVVAGTGGTCTLTLAAGFALPGTWAPMLVTADDENNIAFAGRLVVTATATNTTTIKVNVKLHDVSTVVAHDGDFTIYIPHI